MVRGKDDEEWHSLREFVHSRDKEKCRLCSIMTIKEKFIFDSTKPSMSHLDCAHVFPVSTHPSEVYNKKNVYLICRDHHHRIDDYISPITCKSISMNRHYWWWWRVINNSTDNYNKDIDYELLVKDYILH